MRSLPLALLTIPLLACHNPADPDECAGSKCDGQGGDVVETCTVMSAFDDSGTIASAYDFTLDGDNRADATKALIRVTADEDGALTLAAGEQRFSDVTQAEGVTREDHPFRSYTVESDAFDGPFELRIFDDNRVGMLLRNLGDFPSAFAELDCNPGNTPHVSGIEAVCEGAAEDDNGVCRTPNGRFAPRRCCEASGGGGNATLRATDDAFECTVVVYDDSSSFDSAIGTPYVYSDEGEIFTEPGHWDIEFGLSDFSDRADKLRFDFGGLSIDEEGDELLFTGDIEVERGPTTRTIKTWQFARAGRLDDKLEVRIFTDSGMGLLISAFDGEPKVQMDCRASYQEPEELF